MGSTVFRNPQALSSALAALGTLQSRALGFLNTVDPLDTVSICYLVGLLYIRHVPCLSLITLPAHKAGDAMYVYIRKFSAWTEILRSVTAG